MKAIDRLLAYWDERSELKQRIMLLERKLSYAEAEAAKVHGLQEKINELEAEALRRQGVFFDYLQRQQRNRTKEFIDFMREQASKSPEKSIAFDVLVKFLGKST